MGIPRARGGSEFCKGARDNTRGLWHQVGVHSTVAASEWWLCIRLLGKGQSGPAAACSVCRPHDAGGGRRSAAAAARMQGGVACCELRIHGLPGSQCRLFFDLVRSTSFSTSTQDPRRYCTLVLFSRMNVVVFATKASMSRRRGLGEGATALVGLATCI
jgi:hypothetical protein